jgi:hypothetical protein
MHQDCALIALQEPCDLHFQTALDFL